MPTIRRNLDDINKEIESLKNQASEASKSVKELKTDLRFDPTNVEKISQKYSQLNVQLKKTTELSDKYKSKLALLENELDKLDAASKEAKALSKEIEYLGRTIESTERKIRSLTNELNSNVVATEKARAAVTKINQEWQPYEEGARKASRVTAVLVAAITALVAKSIEAGNELYSLSTRYNVSAENLQKYNRQLEIATGQTDLYTSALQTLSNGFKEIVSGRGIAYEQALRNIGLASKDLIGLSMEERYNAIFEALQNVTDESVRTANAQKLLGDAGAYIAQTAGMTAEELAKVNAETEKYGYLSTEQVEKLHDADIMWQQAKSQLSVYGAELATNAIPLIQLLTSFLARLTPIVTAVADGFGALGETGQTAVLMLGATAILLPKILAFTKALVTWNALRKTSIDAVTTSTIALNAVSAQWQIIILAVVAVLLTILSIIGKIRSKTSQATDEMSALIDKANVLNGVGGEFAATAETTTTYQNTRTIDVGVDIHAAGDTMISDDAAVKVALITADQIQKQLGGLLL